MSNHDDRMLRSPGQGGADSAPVQRSPGKRTQVQARYGAQPQPAAEGVAAGPREAPALSSAGEIDPFDFSFPDGAVQRRAAQGEAAAGHAD